MDPLNQKKTAEAKQHIADAEKRFAFTLFFFKFNALGCSQFQGKPNKSSFFKELN